jgi:SAM-dependent methyltransferase
METASSKPPESLDPRLAVRIEEACEHWIEALWKRSSGLALRFTQGEPGVVERPGRTRFDVRVDTDGSRVSGPLRARVRELPVLDQALGLVVLDRVGAAGAEALHDLLGEAVRALAEDGHLLVIDINPWGRIGLGARTRGRPAPLSAARIARELRAAGLEDVTIEHRLWWPPLPKVVLLRWATYLDALGRRLWPGLGSVYAVVGRKRGSSVIAIPIARNAQRTGVMAAAGSMRRAG